MANKMRFRVIVPSGRLINGQKVLLYKTSNELVKSITGKPMGKKEQVFDMGTVRLAPGESIVEFDRGDSIEIVSENRPTLFFDSSYKVVDANNKERYRLKVVKQ